MNILGISAFYHDSAAAWCATARSSPPPRRSASRARSTTPLSRASAVAYCLQEGGHRRPADLDCVVFYDKPLLKFERLLETYLPSRPAGLRSFLMAMPLWLKAEALYLARRHRARSSATTGTIVFPEHHESHAASAFFPSPFEEAAILTIDGVGEWATTTFGVGRGQPDRAARRDPFPAFAGAALLGLHLLHAASRSTRGEYKLMGLAPYGEPKYVGPDPERADRPQGRRLVPAEHGLLRLLHRPDDDQRAVRRAVRRAAAQARDPTSRSATWTWPPRSRW